MQVLRVQFTIRGLMITVMVIAVFLSVVYPWHKLSPFLIFVGMPLVASSIVIVLFVLLTEFLAWWISR